MSSASNHKYINVVGSSGSGKTTFSKKLAEALGVKHLEIDTFFWGANWTMAPDAEFFAQLKSALDTDAWVLDGNYSRTTPIKWEKVEAVIWLDYSFMRTFWRSIKRAFLRSLKKQEIWAGTGNRESFRKSFFSKDSVILWSISNFRNVRANYEKAMLDDKYAHIEFIRLRHPREAEAMLRKITTNCQ